ncbi:RagB/SusD family nutrient uptake outer membrane protein [Flavobacterium rhizosphaerae]|uniref:RagB/SusD family nutrient uptake outer membrane protein n=1 Tax=Flavobacterium rhizosphaerae TaxID=3163298 RepID=A0ABW8YX81_9FLAO
MKRIIKNYVKIVSLGLLLFAASCEELDLAPENVFTDVNYWTSVSRAQTVLNTAYSQMQNSNYFFYNEALSDNAFNGRGDIAGAASIAAGTYDPSLPRFKDEWGSRYAGIKTCNILLENIDRIQDADVALIERMKGEARFLRAFQHFQLTTWFGDVPLVSSDPSLEEALNITRTPHAEVVEFILNELDAAAAVLPTNAEYAAADKGRITSGAAMALKARVLLYEGRWQEVADITEQLMNGAFGNYSLFPSYEGVFLPQNEYSSEDMLSIQYVPQFRMWGEFFDMAPISVGARLNSLAPTQELVDSYLMLNGQAIDEADSGYNEDNPYTNRDPRLTATVVYHNYQWTNPDGSVSTILIAPGSGTPDEYVQGSSASPTAYYTRKYFDPQHLTSLQSGLNLMLIRYADVLLMHAEAKHELGQFDAGVWDNTIRPIRMRAGFTDNAALSFDTALSQAEIRETIRNERRTEFAMEGLRIFDIRRWEIAEDVLNGWAHGAQFGLPSQDDGYIRANLRRFDPGKHYLWPIPRDERLVNSNLTQNPGW